MLHQHLTVAFRALDSKWGTPVDLDSSASEVSYPSLPAVIEKPATTFSSEEFLRTIRTRPKPYSRREGGTSRRSKMKDSFSNISLPRYQSSSDVSSCCTLKSKTSELEPSLVEELTALVEDLKKPLGESPEEQPLKELTLKKKKRELERAFQKMKKKAFAFIEQKYK